MRLLADENVDAAVVAWLRGRGHDVRYAAEDVQATPDPEVLLVLNVGVGFPGRGSDWTRCNRELRAVPSNQHYAE